MLILILINDTLYYFVNNSIAQVCKIQILNYTFEHYKLYL